MISTHTTFSKQINNINIEFVTNTDTHVTHARPKQTSAGKKSSTNQNRECVDAEAEMQRRDASRPADAARDARRAMWRAAGTGRHDRGGGTAQASAAPQARLPRARLAALGGPATPGARQPAPHARTT